MHRTRIYNIRCGKFVANQRRDRSTDKAILVVGYDQTKEHQICQKVTEQQLFGNTGPSKTLDAFLAFLGQPQVISIMIPPSRHAKSGTISTGTLFGQTKLALTLNETRVHRQRI